MKDVILKIAFNEQVGSSTYHMRLLGDTSEIKFQVVKPLSSAAFATMPDGQPAVKVMRIK